jgi:DnaJ-class molecular chaperone
MELKKEDLINECKKCNGTGYFKETSGSRGGVGVSFTREGTCEECGGGGGTLTESGKAVAAVIRFVKKSGQV